MDPYEFARQQGQVMGQDAPAEVTDAADLMDLLLREYGAAGHLADASDGDRTFLGHFAVFANDYLAEHRVVSTGVVDGAFSLVFEGGQAVPLASVADEKPGRPEVTVQITNPRDSKMKGMKVDGTSVPITGSDPNGRRR